MARPLRWPAGRADVDRYRDAGRARASSRCCCSGCLAFHCRLGRWPWPNPTPNQPTSGREQVHPGAGPGPGWPAGHMPIQAWPGPRPNLPWPNKAASELQGGTHRGGGLRAQGSGEDTNQGRDTQGTRIWISAEAAAAAAGRGTRRWRHHPGKQTHTGLSLTDFVSVDTGNANRESTEVGMQEYLKSSDRQVQTKVLTEDAP